MSAIEDRLLFVVMCGIVALVISAFGKEET
jgi:hypothetical protein